MIAKLIGSRAQVRSLGQEARKTRALIAYAVDLLPMSPDIDLGIGRRLSYVADLHEGDATGEKVRAYGTRNVAGRTLAEIQAEMMALAVQGRCQKSPIAHVVLSWQQDEDPSAAQVEEAVGMLMEDLGGPDLKLVWAVHDNTPNIHVHIVINRVRPSDFRVCQLGDGWAIDTLHQAVARIEARQGWAREPDARYEVAPDGAIRDRMTGRPVRSATGKSLRRKGDRARDAGIRRQQMPAARAAEIINRARSWAELHGGLGAAGIRYVRKGSGAVLRVDGHPHDIKVSTAVRGSSHGKLERRLGPFLPGPAPAELHEQVFPAHKRLLQAARNEVRAHRQVVLSVLDTARDRIFLDGIVRAPGREASAALTADTRRALAGLWASAMRRLGSLHEAALRCIESVHVPNASAWIERGCPTVPSPELPAVLLPEDPVAAALDWQGRRAGRHAGRVPGSALGGKQQSVEDFGLLLVAHEPGLDLALSLAAARWGPMRIVATRRTCEKAEALAKRRGVALVTHVAGEEPGTTPVLPARQQEMATASRTPVPDAARQDQRPASSIAAPRAAATADRPRAGPIPEGNGKASPLSAPARPRTLVETGRAYLLQNPQHPSPEAPGITARATRPDLSEGPAASERPWVWRPLEQTVPSGQSPAPRPPSEARSGQRSSSHPPGTAAVGPATEAMRQSSAPPRKPPPTPAAERAPASLPADRASTSRPVPPVTEAGRDRAPVPPPPASSGPGSREPRAPAIPPPAASVAQPGPAPAQPAGASQRQSDAAQAPAWAPSRLTQPSDKAAPLVSPATAPLNPHVPSRSAGGAGDGPLPQSRSRASGPATQQPAPRPQQFPADHVKVPDRPALPASAARSPSVAAPGAAHRPATPAATGGDQPRGVDPAAGQAVGHGYLAADGPTERPAQRRPEPTAGDMQPERLPDAPAPESARPAEPLSPRAHPERPADPPPTSAPRSDPLRQAPFPSALDRASDLGSPGFDDDAFLPAADRWRPQTEWDRLAAEEASRRNDSWARERSPGSTSPAPEPSDEAPRNNRDDEAPAPKPMDPALLAHLQAQWNKGRGR